jgi:DNA invertase Pin-like site-specific DNA recombinase
MSEKQTHRCAIYTRKSTEEGLDQEFNSLDAQREACEAYVASQAGLGWKLIPTPYNDGGLSGGTMDRPALRQLLNDIQSAKVDVVVVYKIDRLTRSLMDFAKIVDVFDAHRVSFVSVTQQFNTTTSMGRLTLNVLLSFAQFERELSAERVRDKVAASRRRGKWTGGTVPLGYTSKDKKLVIDKAEADTVRTIFRLYLELGSFDLPPNFHPAAIRVSGFCTPSGAGGATGDRRSWSGLRSRSPVAVNVAAKAAGVRYFSDECGRSPL